MLNSKKILITGANGFIGQALCNQLLQQGLEIRAVIRKDIQNDMNWIKLCQGIDTIVHLAAKVHSMEPVFKQDIKDYINSNVQLTKDIALAAAKAGVRKMIYISSSKVHGEYNTNQYFSEQDVPNPQDPYAISKYQAEQILNNIAKETELKITIIRPPLVYGPHVKANFLKLMQMIHKQIPLPLKSVNNKRSMIYIMNLVDVIIKTIENPVTDNNTYLVSDAEILSTAELIKLLQKNMYNQHYKKFALFSCPVIFLKLGFTMLGKKSYIDRLLNNFALNIDKIRKDLNWQPPYSAHQGIATTVEWYRESSI